MPPRNTLGDYLRAACALAGIVNAVVGYGGYFVLGIVAAALVRQMFS